jgi:hypothetical protein
MQTIKFVKAVRSVTSSIKNEYTTSPTDELKSQIQFQIDAIGLSINNPALSCLQDLVKTGKRNNFNVGKVESQVLVY